MPPPLSHDDGRPPGGTSRTPGGRTPRKVQFDESMSESPTHSLDEHGLNPAAFERLTHALERHHATPPAKIHYYPPRPEPAHTIGVDIKRENPSRDLYSIAAATTPTSDGTYLSSGSGSPASYSPYDVPGNYIDSNENAGLPRYEASGGHARHEAEKVVQSHTRKFPGFRGRLRTKRKPKERKHGKHNHLEIASAESTDIEHDAGVSSAPGTGGGVLSALLSLYDQPDTAASSLCSTPGRSSLDDVPEKPWLQPREEQYRRLEEQQPVRPASRLGIEISPSPSLYDPPVSNPKGDILGGKARRIKAKIPSSFSHAGLFSSGKMPHARSSAGVFGPLIASTGNIAGIAAPTSSQIQPDFKRPGYRLSRYSTEEDRPRSTDGPRRPYASQSLPTTGATTPTPPSTPPSAEPERYRSKWSGALKEFPYVNSVRSFGGRSGASTPAQSPSPTLEDENVFEKRFTDEERRKEKKRKRKKAEVFITRHVAKIIQRQEFILKLARAMMMFGGPSHRLQSQIKSTAHVLDIELNCMYLPDVLLISFDDASTSTSNIKFIRQSSSLDLGKLDDAYSLYWKAIHDKLSVSDASAEMDILMRRPQMYNWWQLIIIGGMCSASICTVSFGGSFIDALIVFPFGALLVVIQLLSVRNELYSNVFEVTITTLFSFLAAGLASTNYFCYAAVASSSVVLILPGFMVLCGSLELMSRNMVAGSVRLCYAVVYSLFLGFGLAMGAKAYEQITGSSVVGPDDYNCSITHPQDGPWYQRTPSRMWSFLTVPMFSFFLSLKNQAPYNRKETLLLVVIACIGWVTNYFTGTKFVGQSDIIAGVGAFAVGIVSNLYARLFSGNAFVVMITGILFQVPSGLGSGGLLSYVSQQAAGSSTSYISGFQTALKLVSVAIGLAVGLGISLVITHPIQSRRRAGGIFSL